MEPFTDNYSEDSFINFKWDANNGDGVSLTRTTDGTISVYKGNSVTRSTAGVTDTEDRAILWQIQCI